MGKNIKGGKYAKKQKNKVLDRARVEQPDPEEGQQFAMVMRMLGHCRIMLLSEDGKERMGVIRGSMRKRVFIRPGDIVLAAARDTAEETCDVVHKYDELYVNQLRKSEPQLPFWKAMYQIHHATGGEEDEEDGIIGFEDGSSELEASKSGEEDESDEPSGETSSEEEDEIDIDAI